MENGKSEVEIEYRKNGLDRKTVLTVSAIARKRGIKNPHQLHKKTGISIPRCEKLWKGIGKLDTATLDALCEHLRCKLKDIIRRVPAGSSDFESAIEGRKDK